MAGALTASIAAAFAGSAVATTDPYFNLTTLLLSTTATNGQQNNTFQDSSTNNFTITRNPATGPNAPTQGTFSPFSQTGWGNYFDRASSQYLTVSNSGGQFSFGIGAFTIECWVNLASMPSGSGYPASYWLFGGGPINSDPGIDFYINNTQIGFNLTTFVSPTVIGNHGIAVRNWYHVAVVRGGTSNQTISIFVGGNRVATVSSVTATADPALTGIAISAAEPSGATSGNFNGYISNYRVVKGTAVYDPTLTSLTVPTAPLTAVTNTVLLTCQSNRFIDNSTNNFTITKNGDTRVVPFSPFNPTSAWSASTVGGSGYFDGTGDYLSNTSSSIVPTTGDFTIEGWVYPSQVSTVQYILGTGGGTRLDVYINSSAYVGVQTGGSYRDSSTTKIIANAWNYIAITRTGSTYAIFVNGVSQTIAGTGTMASTITNTPTYIGTYSGTTNNFTGYICGLRVSTVVRTGLTTLPTSPYTSDANTSLLLNFTNSGIYDATAKNVLETVGNAQVSTAQSKWSPTSMYFDGTGDYLLIPDNPSQRIGTGNFTVECWVYRNASGTYGLIGKGTGTTGWLLSLNSSNQVVFTYGSSTITSTGTISATTWTHVAVVRSGTGANLTKIYIGGTNDGTGTVSTDFNQTNAMYVAADRTGGSNANAYVQDTRITLYARYSANFTPPTAAFPVQ